MLQRNFFRPDVMRGVGRIRVGYGTNGVPILCRRDHVED
jgi:hypothetical protein